MPGPVNCAVNLKATTSTTTTSKKGAGKSTHTHTHTREMPVPSTSKTLWVLHGPKSPHIITKNQPGDGLGTPNPIQRCSLLYSPFQPDLRLRLKVKAFEHPFTSLSQVTDLLQLISGRQQMLFPQQKPHSTCYSHLETTLSFLPSSRPRQSLENIYQEADAAAFYG